MPIIFHSNNILLAIGTENTLRGPYDIEGEQRDRLWFQVSFGAGRSAPGSVYSEGRLLSHEDQRGYVGSILRYEQKNQTKKIVKGDFYYGTDLKEAKKLNSMGILALQEIDLVDEDDEDLGSENDERWEHIEDAFQ